MKTRDWFEDMLDAAENLPKYIDVISDRKPAEERKFEVELGQYKTTITYKFNKAGYPIYHNSHTEKIVTEKEKKLKDLEQKLEEAIQSKDFLLAAKIQDEINLL